MRGSVYAGQAIVNKVEEISKVMQSEGLWKASRPGWVDIYNVSNELSVDFFDWIQFVYLPNKLLISTGTDRPGRQHPFIMLQARKHAADEKLSARLRQLLVELDALL